MLRPGVWQGVPAWRPREATVWSCESLDCIGDLKMLEMLGSWDVCQRELQTVEAVQERDLRCSQQRWRSRESEEPFDIRHGDAVWSLPCWVSVLLWSNVSLLCSLSSHRLVCLNAWSPVDRIRRCDLVGGVCHYRALRFQSRSHCT